MTPEARRAAIVEATIEAMREHEAMPTTRQIAQAAHIAEGTIFRVFATKEELRAAVVQRTFDPGQFLRQLSRIDAEQPLRDLLVDIVRVLHARLGATFKIMRALGLSAPPGHIVSESADQIRADTASVLHQLLARHEGELALPAAEFVHIVRLLSFAGSHHEIAHGRTLTPEQTVDILLYGALRRPASDPNGPDADEPTTGTGASALSALSVRKA